ncbi:MAG TPA: hypothetical protein VKJ00_13500 [Thermoanaerobaculia bacterium]|nr:hypothetical protein [Thermoanaerobaculia bacterium]
MVSVGLLSSGVARPAQENRSASTSAQTQVTPAPKTDDANAGAADPNNSWE